MFPSTTVSELARTPNEEARTLVAELSIGLTPLVAAQAPKLFQLNRHLGQATVTKLLVVILRAFVDSVKVPSKPDAADIIEMADTLAQTYTHDSLKDIILALKYMRTQGTKFYQALDSSAIYRAITSYFYLKVATLENQHLDQRIQGYSRDVVMVACLGVETPQVLDNIAARIPLDHPNRESLRRRLSISKARKERGLISEAQHQHTQAEHRQMATRQERKDWKGKTKYKAV
ncbi:hypothetical protein H8B13_09010 [Hymenobacter sp. BT188]|uniref:hypothetical protein n=1 Tax=Hymenobacter sp. BT188 TaxID=2763504 RepID=UPI00165178B6|nr:hypothetical protein [Hymenobacter sp. BT188]MBC6606955.1 hypothetical protein [Hymenobacter sp. BT188]